MIKKGLLSLNNYGDDKIKGGEGDQFCNISLIKLMMKGGVFSLKIMDN